jgi:hypothetical protein
MIMQSWGWGCTSTIPAIREAEVGGLQFQTNWGKLVQDPSEKQTRKQKDWGHSSSGRALALKK